MHLVLYECFQYLSFHDIFNIAQIIKILPSGIGLGLGKSICFGNSTAGDGVQMDLSLCGTGDSLLLVGVFGERNDGPLPSDNPDSPRPVTGGENGRFPGMTGDGHPQN